jgi:hypothetical protein
MEGTSLLKSSTIYLERNYPMDNIRTTNNQVFVTVTSKERKAAELYGVRINRSRYWFTPENWFKSATCKHPAPRIYSWFAYDGTLCAACCDCGKVLAGGAE